MRREKKDRIIKNDDGQVLGRKQQNKRQLSPILHPVSRYDNDDSHRPVGVETDVGQTRSDVAVSYNDLLLGSEERGNIHLLSRSRSAAGSGSYNDQSLDPEELHGDRHLRLELRSVTGSGSYKDGYLGSEERGYRHLGSRLRSVTGHSNHNDQSLGQEEVHSNRHLRSSLSSATGFGSYKDQLLVPEERRNRQFRSRLRPATDSCSYIDHSLDLEKPKVNRYLRSRSESAIGPGSYSGKLLSQEELHRNRHLRSRLRSGTGSGSYNDQSLGPGDFNGYGQIRLRLSSNSHRGQWLGFEEAGRRQLRLGSNSLSDSDRDNGQFMGSEQQKRRRMRSRSSSLSVLTSDEDQFSDGEDQVKRYTCSSSSFLSLFDSDASQFSDRKKQGNEHGNSPTNSSPGFSFHSRSAVQHQSDSEDEIQEYIEASMQRRGNNLSNRNQMAPVKTADVEKTLLHDRKQKSRKPNEPRDRNQMAPAESAVATESILHVRQSRKLNLPRGDFRNVDVISVSVDSNKKGKTALHTNHTYQNIDSLSTNTAMPRQNEQYESRNNETPASTHPKNEKEDSDCSCNVTDKAKAGDGTGTNRIVFHREANSSLQAGTDMKNQGVESLPINDKSSPNIRKSPLVPNYVNQRKTREKSDQIVEFLTLNQPMMLDARDEKVYPRVDAPDSVGSERTASSHAMETQTYTEKPNFHDLELFENFYLLSRNSRVIKKSRHSDKTLRWLQLNGAGQMCRIDGGTFVAVIQTTVGIVCLQTDPTLIIMYKIETRRQYLSICHLFTFKITNDPHHSKRHTFAVTCTDRREDSGNLDEEILLVKPIVSRYRPTIHEESTLRLTTPSMSGICTIHFIKKTYLVVGCIDRVASVLFSNLSITWVCHLNRSPTDVAFMDPMILVCVPDEYRVMAINFENGDIISENILARTDDQGWMPHRISVCRNSFLVKLYSRDRKEVKIVQYTRDENQTELKRRERSLNQ